ncbi:MAG: PIG-L family deacetylase [Verrucomicrobiota bacterium]
MEVLVPDGVGTAEALARVTHLGIGAHQDDLEFFAFHGISQCFQKEDQWFGGITCTDGRGSVRQGSYSGTSDDELKRIRRDEQNRAAELGQYGAMIQLDYSSVQIKAPKYQETVTEDIRNLLEATKPRVLYLHNPADKHDTHVAVFQRSLDALRQIPREQLPAQVFGCEVWRDLDWLPDDLKVALPVGNHMDLQRDLNRVFDSQISGGKRYDLAVMGRRRAHATFHEAHSADQAEGYTFAMDLNPLVQDASLSTEVFLEGVLKVFKEDILKRIART